MHGPTQTQNTTSSGTQSGQFQNQYGWLQMPTTPYMTELHDMPIEVDPSIGYRTAGAIRRSQESMASPMGGYTTPQMRDAIERSQERSIMEEGSQAAREGYYDVNRLKLGRAQFLAGLTAPQLRQTGGTYSGTQTGQSSGKLTSSQSPWGMIGQGLSVLPMSF